MVGLWLGWLFYWLGRWLTGRCIGRPVGREVGLFWPVGKFRWSTRIDYLPGHKLRQVLIAVRRHKQKKTPI